MSQIEGAVGETSDREGEGSRVGCGGLGLKVEVVGMCTTEGTTEV